MWLRSTNPETLPVPRFLSGLTLLVLSILPGCCVHTELRIANHTGRPLDFYTGHTHRTISIPAGRTIRLPHTSGEIAIRQEGWLYRYRGISVPAHYDETIKGIRKLSLPIIVDPGGVITLPSGERLMPWGKSKVAPNAPLPSN